MTHKKYTLGQYLQKRQILEETNTELTLAFSISGRGLLHSLLYRGGGVMTKVRHPGPCGVTGEGGGARLGG